MDRRDFIKSSAAAAAITMTATNTFEQSKNKEDNMILLTNVTGEPGIDTTVNHLKEGMYGIDAMVEGINKVVYNSFYSKGSTLVLTTQLLFLITQSRKLNLHQPMDGLHQQ
jgi:hypothetical protein